MAPEAGATHPSGADGGDHMQISMLAADFCAWGLLATVDLGFCQTILPDASQ